MNEPLLLGKPSAAERNLRYIGHRGFFYLQVIALLTTLFSLWHTVAIGFVKEWWQLSDVLLIFVIFYTLYQYGKGEIVRSLGILSVACFAASAFQVLVMSAGLYDAVIIFLPFLIIFCGWMFNCRVSWLVSVSSMVVVGIAYYQAILLGKPRVVLSEEFELVVFLVLFLMSAIFAHIISKSNAMQHAEREAHINQLKDNINKQEAQFAQLVETFQATNKRLHTAERIASMGQLINGIAQKIDCPLRNLMMANSSLFNNATFVRIAVQEGTVKRAQLIQFLEDFEAASELLARSCQSIANTVESFRKLALVSHPHPTRDFDLRDVISTARARRDHQKRWEVTAAFQRGIVCRTYMEPLITVVHQIIDNAEQHGGNPCGILLITAEVTEGFVKMVFVDDGCGISEENLPRVFDPLFTTKPEEVTTGLGLTIVQNIIHHIFNGVIEIANNSPRPGISVTIVFPQRATIPIHLHNPPKDSI